MLYQYSRSFDKSNLSGTPTLRKENFEDSANSSNFSVRGFLPLIQKDSVTNTYGLAVYVRAKDLSLETSEDSYLYFWLVLLYLVSTSFSSFSYYPLLCAVFDAYLN